MTGLTRLTFLRVLLLLDHVLVVAGPVEVGVHLDKKLILAPLGARMSITRPIDGMFLGVWVLLSGHKACNSCDFTVGSVLVSAIHTSKKKPYRRIL